MNATERNIEEIKQFSGKSSGVRLEGVTKIFPQPDGNGEVIAVNKVNLDIKDGDLVTLLGPSGCGKTTTLRMISGFEYPTSGEIFIGGKPIANVPPNKRGISMVFQSYALFPHLNIYENIAYGLKVKRLPKSVIVEQTKKVIELMQLSGMESRFPNQLSGGQQQRVALARAIVIEPMVLLFDEPLSNLDAKLREHMRDELRSLQKRLGITSLYVTHDQSEAMAISDKIVIMDQGNIIQMGSPREIYEYPNTTFVANFIGKANFLSCEFKELRNGTAYVKVGDLPFNIPNPGSVKIEASDNCCLSIRPESITLVPEGDGIPGVISRATYFGSKIEYEVEIADNHLIVEISNPQLSTLFSEGDHIRAKLDLECVRVLKEELISNE